jgi:hypothetical protein
MKMLKNYMRKSWAVTRLTYVSEGHTASIFRVEEYAKKGKSGKENRKHEENSAPYRPARKERDY